MSPSKIALLGGGLLAAACVLFYALWLAGPDKSRADEKSPTTVTHAASNDQGADASASASGTSPGTEASTTASPGGLRHLAPPAGGGPDQAPALDANSALGASGPEGVTPTSQKQTILSTIEVSSISYDPVELPRIRPFLTDPDPDIRAAALNGVVVLGHADGAPLLRAAAKQSLDPNEAAKLLEAATYLELPPANIRLVKKRPTGTQPKQNVAPQNPPGGRP